MVRNERGSMMMMALVSIAISGIMVAVMSTMITNANRDVKSLTQKIEMIDTKSAVLGALVNSNICVCNLDPTKNTAAANTLRFNANNLATASISLPVLYGSCNAAGTGPGTALFTAGQPLPGTSSALVVESIKLENIIATGTGTPPTSYKGDLAVYYTQASQVLSRKPQSVSVNFQADVTNPAQARITGCMASAAGVPTGGTSGGTGGPLPTGCQVQSYRYSGGGTSSTVGPTPAGCSMSGSPLPRTLNCGCPNNKRRLMCIEGVDSGQNGCSDQVSCSMQSIVSVCGATVQIACCD